MTYYLFCFNIGPVKEFILQSRKSQDLFAGSALLSYLTKVAIDETILQVNQGESIIITPRLNSKYKPNRFVAKIKNQQKLNLHIFGQNIENKVKSEFKKIGSIPFSIKFQKPEEFDEQIADFLEIHWLFIPEENDYHKAYQKLFKELNTLKNLTNFNKFEETGRKCSVDGKYNVKIYRKYIDNYQKEEIIHYNNNKNGITKLSKLYQGIKEVNVLGAHDEKNLKIYHLQEGEGLSAITLIKRIFNLKNPNKLSLAHQFPSTANISLYNWIHKIKHLNEYKKYKTYVIDGKYYSGHSNDQLFYQENIVNIVNKADKTKTDEVINLFKVLMEKIKVDNIIEPITKYYALIKFDGDDMGEWLTGKFLLVPSELEEFHKVLTTCIDNFARKLDLFLKPPRGIVIYAGGEDFMAMINIHHIFKVINKIHHEYENEINQKLKIYKTHANKDMTISVGVSIAHYKQPMQTVIENAKLMEVNAKINGKNCISIGIQKHSGNTQNTIFKWNSLEVLLRIQNKIKKGYFSSAFLREIFLSIENYGLGIPFEILVSKIKLHVPRSATTTGKFKINDMIDDLSKLLQINGIKEFAESLLIIDFLIRKSAN